MTDTLFADLQALVTIAKSRQSKTVASLRQDAHELGITGARFDDALALWRTTIDETGGLARHDPREDARTRVHPEPLHALQPYTG